MSLEKHPESLGTFDKRASGVSKWREHLTLRNSFNSHEYGKNKSKREPAHAQTKHQDNSTSGRGARASYRTISPRSHLPTKFIKKCTKRT